MFLNLLCLIVLATSAHKFKKPVVTGMVYGALKSLGVYFLQLSETSQSYVDTLIMSVFHFAVNALLGIAIAYFVVKVEEKRKSLVVPALVLLVILTFAMDWIPESLLT